MRLKGVRTPEGGDGHTYQQYVVRVPGNGRPDRDAFARAVRAKGVECRVPVKTPGTGMPGFRRDVCLPETERAADETLALPVDVSLTKREMQRIVSACNALGGLLQPPSDRGTGGWEHAAVRGMIYFVAARETSKRRLAPIAQSAERLHGKEKVNGSIPFGGSSSKRPRPFGRGLSSCPGRAGRQSC